MPPGAGSTAINTSRSQPDAVKRGTGKGHGRHAFGSKVATAKLSERNVRRVRELGGLLTQREIGRVFGVHHRTVFDIQRRATWRHVT